MKEKSENEFNVNVTTFLKGKCVYSSIKRQDVAKSNEDALEILEIDRDNGVLILADGAGGLPQAAQASGIAIDIVKKEVIQGKSEDDGLRASILNGFEEANRRVMDATAGAATTLCVVEVGRRGVRSFHVGDSGVLVVGNRGRIKLETIPHSPVGYALHSGLISEEAAMMHEDRHMVSNMVGSKEMHVEMSSWTKMTVRDTLILASDGVWDNLYLHEVVDKIRKGPIDRAGKNLLASALQRMYEPVEEDPSKPDDLSFILMRTN